MNRIANAWHISKASCHVLSQDRELIAIPIIAGIAAVMAFVVVGSPGFLLLGGDNGASNVAGWIFVVLAAVVGSWIVEIGQAAVIAGAGQRMDGQDPDLSSAFAVAKSRLGRLLEWALLATVVSIILDQLEQRFGMLGRIVGWLGNVAFSILSFLALPVIVFENLGAIAAFKRSSQLLKTTWGEQVSFGFGMGLLSFLLMLPVLIVAGLGLSTGILPLQIIGGAFGIVAIGAILAVTSALSAVFKAALYRYAVGAPVADVFAPTDLREAFQHR
jgi:hypothetical protein